ncbi:MAG: NADH:ubiquinone reductase (Na(+)-transporting) subunit A, partial [Holophagales bacterium]|nr:NADH:ubiquinone reductase (Na(+)-transporting) subunit A [Holophagales bacterium]
MSVHKIKKGLDLPITGEPDVTRVDSAAPPSRVALVASDYHGLKPTMHVEVGEHVRRGQLVMEDKKNPGVRFTAPGAGTIAAVHRGAKRALQSLVIELDDDERAGKGESVRFAADSGKHPSELGAEQVEALLVESGLWTAIRTRPFDRVATPGSRPRSIFVTACDSHPLAPPMKLALAGREGDFERGLVALSQLRDPAAGGKVYVCTDSAMELPIPGGEQFGLERFSGPHPSGTVGVHIHTLDPVDRNKLVWHVGYQDTIAIGRLFADGSLDVRRIVSLAGPVVKHPRVIETRVGASTDELVEGELTHQPVRVISGSVLSGTAASGELHGYLGRFANQISVIESDTERILLGWLGPGADKFSLL